MLQSFLKVVAKRKLLSGVIVLVLVGGGYWSYQTFFASTSTTRYITAAVEKGTLVVSLSGSGQVSASNQVDIKPKVSGTILSVGVKNGDTVKAGAILAKIDSQDAEKSMRDAKANLENANLSLQKLKQPADALSLLQAENSLAQAKESKQSTEDDLKKAYDDGFNTVANAFIDISSVMTGLQGIVTGTDYGSGQANIDYYANAVQNYDEKVIGLKDDASIKFQEARKEYDKNFLDYKSVTRFSSNEEIEALLNETYNTTKTIAEAVKSTNNLIQFYADKLTAQGLKPQPLATTHLSSLSTYTGRTSSQLISLLGIEQTIQNDKNAIVNSDRSIAEKTESLAKLKNGPDPLDIQSQELTVTQRYNALLDAQETLANYFIRAPFDGIVAKIPVKIGDQASSGTIIATLVTSQKLATVALNEVDIAKVKVGQKVTLVFDAIPDLNITGEVTEIDTIGTTTQGVVTYGTTMGFDTQDDRVKPGMSVSASIITDVRQDVFLVPSTAIKQQGNSFYVEVMKKDAVAPVSQQIQIGLSNDTSTEVISGLSEGEMIVTQTITSSTTSTSTQSSQGSSGIRIPGLTGGGGGGR